MKSDPNNNTEILSKTSTKPILIGIGAYNCVVFEFFTAAAMVVGVGGLMTWHIRLISRGETSIEQHINKETNEKFTKLKKVVPTA